MSRPRRSAGRPSARCSVREMANRGGLRLVLTAALLTALAACSSDSGVSTKSADKSAGSTVGTIEQPDVATDSVHATDPPATSATTSATPDDGVEPIESALIVRAAAAVSRVTTASDLSECPIDLDTIVGIGLDLNDGSFAIDDPSDAEVVETRVDEEDQRLSCIVRAGADHQLIVSVRASSLPDRAIETFYTVPAEAGPLQLIDPMPFAGGTIRAICPQEQQDPADAPEHCEAIWTDDGELLYLEVSFSVPTDGGGTDASSVSSELAIRLRDLVTAFAS